MLKTNHRLINADSRKISQIETESIDLVITSPPYPMIEMWDKVFETMNPELKNIIEKKNGNVFELMHRELDHVWCETIRALKPGGIACINIGDATRSIDSNFQLFPNHSRIIQAFTAKGINNLTNIIWRKPTNAPNKFMGSGMLPAGAYVTLEHEYILIFRKGSKREFKSEENKILRAKSAFFWEERNKWFSDIWEIKGATQKIKGQNRNRSAAFPIELPYRLIQMYSLAGDTIFDPFNGTGTTTLSSIISGRSSVGSELDPKLIDAFKVHLESLTIDQLQKIPLDRLNDHKKFVDSKPLDFFIHHNKHYQFPVKTKQETGIVIPMINTLQLDENNINVTYN
ncbi:MAG: site-specific DNA-methyltransferase [Bacteroidetes bacterium]|nr:site-specific DNA-methyltransferase [Bacteroidota bacterium]